MHSRRWAAYWVDRLQLSLGVRLPHRSRSIMPSVPPLHDQVRTASRRTRAYERALSWCARPSFSGAAILGASFGVGSTLVTLLEQWIPVLAPRSAFTAPELLGELAWRVAVDTVLALSLAALVRAARWAYFRARFGARAT